MNHPLIARFDALADREDLTAAERLVLFALLRHGDWDTGADCYPSIATIAKWCALNERTVRRALGRLTCARPVNIGGVLAPCLTCGHLDLIVLTRKASQHETACYALVVGAVRQGAFAEVAGGHSVHQSGHPVIARVDILSAAGGQNVHRSDPKIRDQRSDVTRGVGAVALFGPCGISGCDHNGLRREWQCRQEASA